MTSPQVLAKLWSNYSGEHWWHQQKVSFNLWNYINLYHSRVVVLSFILPSLNLPVSHKKMHNKQFRSFPKVDCIMIIHYNIWVIETIMTLLIKIKYIVGWLHVFNYYFKTFRIHEYRHCITRYKNFLPEASRNFACNRTKVTLVSIDTSTVNYPRWCSNNSTKQKRWTG